MQPRVLIVSPQVFPKPHSGAGMRGHFQAVHLSKFWPVTLATESGLYSVTNGVFKALDTNEITQASNTTAYIRCLLTNRHYLFEKYKCAHWDVPAFANFTHVIIHYPALLHLLNADPRAVIILETHNNEREYYNSVADRTTNPLKRVAIRRQSRVSEKLIENKQNLISATVSVSENDRDWVTQFSTDSTKHFLVPNNLFRYQPTQWSGSKKVLFVGSLSVTMNVQAIDWFTQNVWLRLAAEEPELQFVVAGRNPSPHLVERLHRQNIEVVANAESLTSLYEDAMCSVVPASSGSGSKIKVAESLAHGVPVLTTAYGLVGQPADIRDCCIAREKPFEWIEALKEIARRTQRSEVAWDIQVKHALDDTYFGHSVNQLVEFIRSN